MGYTPWKADRYQAAQSHRAATGSAFSYHQAQAARPVGQRRVHDGLSPQWTNKAGQKIRESRDSAAHPDALAIATLFDQTGSMGQGPVVLQRKLGTLMKVLLERGYVASPHVLFGAIGDAHAHETAPLQVGQFESGLEMDTQLDNLYLEGMGAGNGGETYGLGLYFMARHTSIDCWEKRHQKGFLFLIGDECPHRMITRQEVSHYVGDNIAQDLTIEQAVAEAQRTYEVFFLHVRTGSAIDQGSLDVWRKLLGDHVIQLEGLDNISEIIAITIGMSLGVIGSASQGVSDLIAAGADVSAVKRAGNSLAQFTPSRDVAARSTGRLPMPRRGQGGSNRL